MMMMSAGCDVPFSITIASSAICDRMRPEGQVRIGLAAGGKETRTLSPAVKERPFRPRRMGFFAGTYRNVRLADAAAAGCSGLEALQVYLSFSLAIQASASVLVANALAAVVGRVPVTVISTADVPSFSGTTR